MIGVEGWETDRGACTPAGDRSPWGPRPLAGLSGTVILCGIMTGIGVDDDG